MGGQFHVNACVKLKPSSKNSLNICEIPTIISEQFVADLKKLYEEVLFRCVKELKTSKLTIVSIKIMPFAAGIRITANVLLDAVKSVNSATDHFENYRRVDLAESESKTVGNLSFHRFIRYMEARAMAEVGKNFEALIHMRIVPFEKDDISPEKF
ncbi:MAG TPA: hypothetical protein ENN28_03825 [Candidatus Uhrbacteria bacterium]|nr:hypothetical protein [Candidatus Uhrbacteria bacterium]